jgi:hypothetical protein
LLCELAAAGISIKRDGDGLRVRARPGVSIAAYRERIREAKPALLAVLREREGIAALGPEPALPWVHVSTAPVAATLPPAGWEGTIPAGCGVPAVCHVLGPCPCHAASGRCWTEEPAL